MILLGQHPWSNEQNITRRRKKSHFAGQKRYFEPFLRGSFPLTKWPQMQQPARERTHFSFTPFKALKFLMAGNLSEISTLWLIFAGHFQKLVFSLSKYLIFICYCFTLTARDQLQDCWPNLAHILGSFGQLLSPFQVVTSLKRCHTLCWEIDSSCFMGPSNQWIALLERSFLF